MSNFIRFVISTSGCACAVLVGVAWLRLRPRSVAPVRYVLGVGLLYLLASVYGVSAVMVNALAAGYRQLEDGDVPAGPTAVVLLGSGSQTVRDWHGGNVTVLDRAGAARTLEAARAFRVAHADWIVSSGGRGTPTTPDQPSGVTMRDLLVQLGVPADRIVVDDQSENTREEAVIVAPLLASLHVTHVVLVTSRAHMLRALGTFRAVGIEPIPAVARELNANETWSDWMMPTERGLGQTSSVVHELVGLGYYAARGWYRLHVPPATRETGPS